MYHIHSLENLENLMWINQRVHTRDHNNTTKAQEKKEELSRKLSHKTFPPRNTRPPCSSVRAFCGGHPAAAERGRDDVWGARGGRGGEREGRHHDVDHEEAVGGETTHQSVLVAVPVRFPRGRSRRPALGHNRREAVDVPERGGGL